MSKHIRMSAKDYREEYDNLTVKINALEARIAMRLLTLCKQNPDAPVARKPDSTTEGTIIYAKSFKTSTAISYIPLDTKLKFIETIEKYLVDKHPHKQTSIEFNS